MCQTSVQVVLYVVQREEIERINITNLFTTRVGTREIVVRPSVQISIRTAYSAVSRPTNSTLQDEITSKNNNTIVLLFLPDYDYAFSVYHRTQDNLTDQHK